jgi:hypothetical protein
MQGAVMEKSTVRVLAILAFLFCAPVWGQFAIAPAAPGNAAATVKLRDLVRVRIESGRFVVTLGQEQGNAAGSRIVSVEGLPGQSIVSVAPGGFSFHNTNMVAGGARNAGFTMTQINAGGTTFHFSRTTRKDNRFESIGLAQSVQPNGNTTTISLSYPQPMAGAAAGVQMISVQATASRRCARSTLRNSSSTPSRC